MQPFYGLTKNLNARVLGGALAVLALALFVPFTSYVTQQRVSTTPQADQQTATAETSISLVQHRFDCLVGDPQNGIPSGSECNDITVGKTIALDVLVRSDIDASNLVNVDLTFSKQLSVTKIIAQSSGQDSSSSSNGPQVADDFFITSWVNRHYDNDQSTIQLVGAVPNPGFTTNQKNTAPIMARIYFKVLTPGQLTVSVTPDSAVYRDADNANILKTTRNFDLLVR